MICSKVDVCGRISIPGVTVEACPTFNKLRPSSSVRVWRHRTNASHDWQALPRLFLAASTSARWHALIQVLTPFNLV